MSRNRGSVGILVNQEKILLGKRAKDPYKDHWSGFGGHIEIGESSEQALVRECCEELGIDILSFSITEQGADDNFLLWIYKIDDWRGTIKFSSEVSEIRWVSLNDLKDLLLIPITRKMIEKHLTRAQ